MGVSPGLQLLSVMLPLHAWCQLQKRSMRRHSHSPSKKVSDNYADTRGYWVVSLSGNTHLARDVLPAYELDNGPLTDAQHAAITKMSGMKITEEDLDSPLFK